MNATDSILRNYAFNLDYARSLTEDLSEEQFAAPGDAGSENHPAFTLGHLVVASSMLAASLGAERDEPPGWADLFGRTGPGDPRTPAVDAHWPSRGGLMDELARQHDRVELLLRALEPDRLAEPVDWRFAGRMPTLGDVVVFMANSHESMHLGQLAAWRRAWGLPSALAAMTR